MKKENEHPRADLNCVPENQNLICYRYITGICAVPILESVGIYLSTSLRCLYRPTNIGIVILSQVSCSL